MRIWPLSHIFRMFIAICFIANSSLAAAQPLGTARLPTLGDDGEMSASAERRLGDDIARELYRDPDYIDDPQLLEYVGTIWQALLGAARSLGEISPELDEHFSFELFLEHDRTVNAFALPGGFMGVNLGLIGVVATPDELASVLAHELSHITQRHIARLIGRQAKTMPLMLGAMVLGILAASKNPQAAQALAVGGQALVVQNQLNFSRDMEREADRVGMGLMVPAGFSPRGFVDMFDKLQQANRINDNGSWPYLRNHPLTTQRIADMQARQPRNAVPPHAPGAFSLEAHGLLAARARVLAGPGVDALRQWEDAPADRSFATLAPAERAATLYAGVLAASQLNQPATARSLLARLWPLVAQDAAASRQVRLLAADVALRAGQPEAALPELLATGASQQRPELLLRAQALLALGRASEISGDLQSWVALHPHDAGVWQALASNLHAQGQVLRAVRAEGEARAAQYDYAGAVDRFKAGQALAAKSSAPADYVEVSIIDTRLRAMQSLLREQAAER